jgi:hypothetical protein
MNLFVLFLMGISLNVLPTSEAGDGRPSEEKLKMVNSETIKRFKAPDNRDERYTKRYMEDLMPLLDPENLVPAGYVPKSFVHKNIERAQNFIKPEENEDLNAFFNEIVNDVQLGRVNAIAT